MARNSYVREMEGENTICNDLGLYGEAFPHLNNSKEITGLSRDLQDGYRGSGKSRLTNTIQEHQDLIIRHPEGKGVDRAPDAREEHGNVHLIGLHSDCENVSRVLDKDFPLRDPYDAQKSGREMLLQHEHIDPSNRDQ
eukprot:c35189_g1_i1 orf=720-1133(-)